MGEHALLSPSGASRWLACTPSARAELEFPNNSSSAAEEGTLAHSLSELYLRNYFKMVSLVEYNSTLKKIKHHKFYTKELDNHCVDYCNFVVEKFQQLENPMVFLEDRVDITEYVPEGFGTVDCVIIAESILDITDLKFGKGVLVEAHENKQMMLYALGALKKYNLLYDLTKVKMTIYQPRLNNFSSFEISADDLISWGESFVKPKALEAFNGAGIYTPGSHCKFCRNRNHCKALADNNMQLAKHAFADPNKLTDEDISEILEKAPDFKTWLTNIQNYALAEAVNNGKKWPKFKLVAGKSSRLFVDEEAIKKTLAKSKIKPEFYMSTPKLLGITALEKNLGKTEVEKLIGDYIIKPPGAATLVPSWDKRAELNSAEAAKIAFDEIDSD